MRTFKKSLCTYPAVWRYTVWLQTAFLYIIFKEINFFASIYEFFYTGFLNVEVTEEISRKNVIGAHILNWYVRKCILYVFNYFLSAVSMYTNAILSMWNVRYGFQSLCCKHTA
jgi:hypothetical protein